MKVKVEEYSVANNDYSHSDKLWNICASGYVKYDQLIDHNKSRRELYITDESSVPSIRDVKYYGLTTVVWWDDGIKTVVICRDGDEYNKEIGLLMAIAKRAFGNKGKFNNVLRKWVENYEKS